MPRGSVTAQNYSLARHPSAFTQHRATAAPRRATTKGSFLRRGSQEAAKTLAELTVPSRAGRSGYLLKQGVGNRAWKSRWFVLPGRDQLAVVDARLTSVVNCQPSTVSRQLSLTPPLTSREIGWQRAAGSAWCTLKISMMCT